jgi:A/G-specific adenine glycosylase
MEKITKSHSLNPETARADFRTSLLSWFDEYQRELPWRTHPSLYKTVVSEFMLQQTRVTTALPYFERWTEQFPDFSSLAAAGEEEVLKAWEGLGYYSRARNLHKLAKEIVGWPTIPEDAESWQALPGIGPYMAAAVTSISFGFPEAASPASSPFPKPFGTEPPPKEKFVRWPRPCSTGRAREISTRR